MLDFFEVSFFFCGANRQSYVHMYMNAIYVCMYIGINKRSYAHLSAKYLIREEQRVPRLSGSQVAVIAYKHTHIYTQTDILLLNCFIFACLFYFFFECF